MLWVSKNVHSIVTNQCQNVVIFSQSHVEEIKLTERMRDILLDSKTMKLKEIQHLLIKVRAFLRGFVNCFVDMMSESPVCLISRQSSNFIHCLLITCRWAMNFMQEDLLRFVEHYLTSVFQVHLHDDYQTLNCWCLSHEDESVLIFSDQGQLVNLVYWCIK